ncbi:MAG: hypothetical protein FH749_04515 [Firmicutes bacterium]|nr:hypothetical protein [Bacillota bacterium]
MAGDLTGDGQVELVTAQNADRFDNHHTTTVCAQRLDGTVLWRWGDPNAGKKGRSFDVACQIYDWRGTKENNVILLTDRELIELDGRQGTVLRRWPIPKHASDMLMFVNVSGKERATDILIKDRYHRLWVYDEDGNLLWSVRDPGGYMLAHQPLAFDLDGDGRDEILAGFALLNHDGSTRWVYESNTVKLWFGGHLDSAQVLRLDQEYPENTRIVITYCDAGGIAMLDGNGKQLWEITGRHFETVSAARLLPDRNELQLVVDVSHLAMDEPGECWILSETGVHLATLRGSHRAHPANWLDNGRDQLLFVPKQETDAKAESALIAINTDFYLFQTGNITGNGARDALFIAGDELLIYANEAAPPRPSLPLGSGTNFSTYNSQYKYKE